MIIQKMQKEKLLKNIKSKLNKKGENSSEPELAKKCWHTLIQTYGRMKPSLFEREYDRKNFICIFFNR